MKKLVALTGAGISAESGIPTFRDAGGLWEGYDVMEVASIEGWIRNPALVLDFYNQRRKNALQALPNAGHEILAELQKDYDVTVITQNVDNLHEQAGSTEVLHLHGSLFESRSEDDPSLIFPIDGWELKLGDKCPKGAQLRPNIVWFGEIVDKMEDAALVTAEADIFLVVGTSLQVYPAASLLEFTPAHARKIVVDPGSLNFSPHQKVTFINEKASTGLIKVREMLLSQF